MHERTQRALARMMFVLCCAVPTSGTLLAILVTWTPWYHERCRLALQKQLSDETGLVVKLDDFQQTSPYLVTLHGVLLSEPETQREVASFRMVEWATRTDTAAIRIHQPQIQSEQFAAFWQLVNDRYLSQPSKCSRILNLIADDLTIQSRNGRPFTFRSLSVHVQPHARAVYADVRAIPATARDETPIRIKLQRDRTGNTPTTTWSLETGGTALPCSALADFSNHIKQLGPDAQFHGNLGCQIEGDIWRFNLASANFFDVDLSKLSESLTHSLSGKARISFARGYIDPHREVDINGSIVVRDGSIGDSLMRSANQHLEFVIDEQSLNGHKLPFDWLSLNFNLLGPQLRLWGTCRGLPGYESLTGDVAICADGRSIAWSTGALLPSSQLAVALAPSYSVNYPLSQQTSWITNLLLPPSRPLPIEQSIRDARITRTAPWASQPSSSQPAIAQPANSYPPQSYPSIAHPPASDKPVSMNR